MKRIVIAVTSLAVLLFALAATPAYSTEKAPGKACATAAQTAHQDCAKAECCKDGTCACCPDDCACCTGGACVCKDGQCACCKGGACKPKACFNGGCRKAKK